MANKPEKPKEEEAAADDGMPKKTLQHVRGKTTPRTARPGQPDKRFNYNRRGWRKGKRRQEG